ncbi:MAG: chloride channel protein [Chitinophagaceae bacterium]|nr:chloride channel protein [Silvanigrellaceae bacterium]MBY0480248.1 chloride channel protein [Chitinophagaceae bacterium]
MALDSSIREFLRNTYNKVYNTKTKKGFLQAIPFWIASIITGLVAVMYAKLFSFAELGTKYLVLNYNWSLFIITPICFIIAWYIVKKFASNARGSGIPQVMASIELSNVKHNHLISKLLSIKIISIKVISSLVMVFGGGAIGREGPTIQIAASIFQKINSSLPKWWPKVANRNMIITGAAAGLAAAFNTPLGGIVFTIEELTKTHISYFKTALFSAVIIAGLTAQAILGPYLYLGLTNAEGGSIYLFLGIIVVAIITGLIASLMCKIILKVMNWKSGFTKSIHQLLFLLVSGLLLATFSFCVNHAILGSGKELMTNVLFTDHKSVEWYVPILRIIGPILSFSSGAAGGIFAPALSAGACLGSYVAHIFELTGGNANLLILVGMVGFLTGVTRTPFTSAILVLEMTDRHNIIFQLMLAGMISSIVSLIIDKHSFYDHLKIQYLKALV